MYIRVEDGINDNQILGTGEYARMKVPVSITNLNDQPLMCYNAVVRYVVRDGDTGTLARIECVDPDQLVFEPTCSLISADGAFSLASATGYSVSDYVGACEIEYDQVDYDDATCGSQTFCFQLQVQDWTDSAGTTNTATVEIVVQVQTTPFRTLTFRTVTLKCKIRWNRSTTEAP